MGMQADANLIKHSVLGQDLSDQDAQLLASITRHRKLQADELLYEADTQDNNLYVIASGKISVGHQKGDRWEEIATLREGAMVGEMSFVDGNAHTLSAKALKPTEVLVINRDEFEQLVERSPMTCYHIMRAIIRNGHKLQKEMNARFIEMTRFIQNQYTV